LVYADDVIILGGILCTIKKNTESYVVASKEVGQEVNADKTKYKVMSRYQNAEHSHNIKTDNRVEEFKYLGTTITNQNSIQDETKIRLKSGNASYYSVQNLLSSNLLSKNLKINIYKTIILLVVLYGCETWSLTLREKCRVRVFESRVLKRIFGSKSEVTGEWRKLHNEELNNLYSSPNIAQVIKSRIMRWAGHVAQMRERRGIYRGLVGKPEGKRPLGRHRHRREDIKMDLQELECGGMDWISLAQDRNR